MGVGGGGLAGREFLESALGIHDAAFELFAIAARVDGGPFHLLDLLAEGAQLAAPRQQAGDALPRANGERAIGENRFAGGGDEVEAAAGAVG